MTDNTISTLISVKELKNILHTGDLILIDARSGQSGKAAYLKNHLVGASHVDLNSELSDIKQDLSIGGRHPLPTPEQFSKILTSLGIAEESHVVIYDDKSGANAAARLWWMLRSIGHEQVQVLDGGLAEAVKQGCQMSSEIQNPVMANPYPIVQWTWPLSDIDEVEKVSQGINHVVIDVRSPERYSGQTEPIDLIAGHIPGSINVPYLSNLADNGLFLSSDELKEKYLKIWGETPPDNIIVHCGSGVTACHTLLAIAHAQMKIPKLYVGSWSEWSRNNKEMITTVGE